VAQKDWSPPLKLKLHQGTPQPPPPPLNPYIHQLIALNVRNLITVQAVYHCVPRTYLTPSRSVGSNLNN